jgi:DNA polymerase III subunit gamma/tau
MQWNDVVGQPRAIAILQAVLKNPRFLQRGMILSGAVGVGKTTSAYLMAKALMCRGTNPLGCGECPSCVAIQTEGIDKQSDFIEVDGAVNSGVDAARKIVDDMQAMPVLARRRVVIIDEAHFLSDEAWGAYLKILEEGDTDSVFLFITSAAGKIRKDILSRCIRASFERVAEDTLIGHLANVANSNAIPYELDALKLLAHHSKGIVRDAVQYLDTTAALGTVDVANVKLAVDTSLEDLSLQLLQTIATRNQVESMKLADELIRRDKPGKVAESMLSIYSKAIYSKDPEMLKIYRGLPDVGAVAAVLAKWATFPYVPADVITVIVYELLKTQNAVRTPAQIKPASGTAAAPAMAPKTSGLAAYLDDEAV